MVRFPLGGADRCGCGGSGPLHQPQGLEGVMVEALLSQEALCRVEQQQVLHRERERDIDIEKWWDLARPGPRPSCHP